MISAAAPTKLGQLDTAPLPNYEEIVAAEIFAPPVEVFPTTMGECIDQLYTMRAARLALEKEATAAKAKEEALRIHIIDTFGADNLNGAQGSIASASISPDIQPQVLDWPLFYAYIKENDAFDLLERRIGRLAYKARLDDGVEVPGTTHIDVVKLNLTKRGGSRRK